MKPDWKMKEGLAAGKGATVQEFFANVGGDKFEIDVAPWGEGNLRVNGRQVAHINDAKDRRGAFRELKKIADRFLDEQAARNDTKENRGMIPAVKAKLLEGKKGLIVGIANENSIAWGCAKAFRAYVSAPPSRLRPPSLSALPWCGGSDDRTARPPWRRSRGAACRTPRRRRSPRNLP